MPGRAPRFSLSWRHAAGWPGGLYASVAPALILASALLALPAPPARAATGDRLQEVERALKKSEADGKSLKAKAEKLATEVAAVRRKLVAAARAAQAHERAMARIERRIKTLTREERATSRDFRRRRRQLALLLGALERIARYPPEALIAYSDSPQDTLRSAILLRSAVPRLETRARALKAELAALGSVREQLGARRKELDRTGAALKEKRKELAVLLGRKRLIERKTRAARAAAVKRARKLAREAGNLRELFRGLERQRESLRRQRAARNARVRLIPPRPRPSANAGALRTVPSIAKARGRLVRPAAGRVVTRFGARHGAAVGAKGIRLTTRPRAQVVAPFRGTVVFAGPFRGYGRLLIIDHGEGYHTLLAGLGRIDVAVGQALVAGEPVGTMAALGTRIPRLYIELRRDGRPVDPLPWLATSPIDKVSG